MCCTSFIKVKHIITLSMQPTHTHFQSCHLPVTSLVASHLLPLWETTRDSAAATQLPGQLRSWWARGSTGSFRLEERKASVWQWRLAAEWPLSALGLYLFSHQPKAFDPSLKSRTGRKILYFSWWLANEVWLAENAGAALRKTWPRTSQGPEDSSVTNRKENNPHFFL